MSQSLSQVLSWAKARLLSEAKATEPHPSFLGRGWSFPPSFNPLTASVEMASAEVDVHQSIGIILSTRLGERIMLATFGCDLESKVFGSLTATSANEISRLVSMALTDWEPRIKVVAVSTMQTELQGWVEISIEYLVLQTNSRSNLVFPFYLNEASLPAPTP